MKKEYLCTKTLKIPSGVSVFQYNEGVKYLLKEAFASQHKDNFKAVSIKSPTVPTTTTTTSKDKK